MNKKYKILYKLIGFALFVLFLFFLKNETLKADVIVFEYKTGPIPATYGGFKTQVECENNRTLFMQNNLGSTSTMCQPVTLPGEPVITNEYVVVTPQSNQNEEVDPNTYKLLAPIGDFEEITTNNIGDYFNKFFLLAIGLAAALAVIMLIIGGVQWMGTDSVFGKTEAKKQITQAILGLLIAIGSYALLNTINPDLLGKRGLSVDRLSIEIEKEDVPWAQYSSGGSIALCPEGFTNVADGGTPAGVINVCKSIASNLEKLIADAKKENILLSGYGSRSEAQQRALRIKNGCPDIENSPAEDCNPPTARIGRSMHESGKAIDFRCNGKSMMESGGKNSPCFKWLANNAHNYGLKNLASEPWHWSTTGR
ncbi:MAG: D-alanyl-D-alanine carboxypeptidase family protein [Candidatus Pacebacteria bacterium]|nr:D-alanyl-D-alanine carboxypeptidase family protein [Candidatus Paceibacterota bacterium]